MYAYIYILKFPTKFAEHLHTENMWYVLVGALKLQLGIPGIWSADVTKEDGPAFLQLDSLLRKVLLFLVDPGSSGRKEILCVVFFFFFQEVHS